MKLLIINGSPKKELSSTLKITKAFVTGNADEYEQTIINAIDANVAPCLGCLMCWQKGSCVQKDDMTKILEQISESDVIIFSYPLYCYGMPAPLKAIVDRLLPLTKRDMHVVNDRVAHVSRNDMRKHHFVMISGCGFPNFAHNFEPAIQQFHQLFGENAVTITIPEAPMFDAKEAEIVTIPFLKVVQQAGAEYFKNGQISPETQEKLAIPMIPQEQYLRIVNGN